MTDILLAALRSLLGLSVAIMVVLALNIAFKAGKQAWAKVGSRVGRPVTDTVGLWVGRLVKVAAVVFLVWVCWMIGGWTVELAKWLD